MYKNPSTTLWVSLHAIQDTEKQSFIYISLISSLMAATATTTTTTTVTSSSGKELKGVGDFDMGSLRTHLPQKRGLSEFFSGKSRSFLCLADAKCIDDLKKADIPEAKRKKYSDRRAAAFHAPLSCRTETGSSSYCRSFVGV